MKVYLIPIFVVLFVTKTIAQKRNEVDSLRQIIATTNDDATKIAAYKGFYPLYITSYPDSVKYYSKKGMLFAEKAGNVEGFADFSVLIAFVDYQKGALKEAHFTIDRALKAIDNDANHLPSELKLLNWKGVFYDGERKYDSAQTILTKIVTLSKDYPLEQLSAYLILGNISFEQLQYQKALHYYHKVDSVCLANNFDDSACDSALGNSGMILFEIGQLDESLEYLQRAQQKDIKRGDTLMALALNDNVAKIHLRQGNHLLAEELLLESTQYFERNDYPRKEIEALKVLNTLYQGQSNFTKAESILDRALKLSMQIQDTLNIAEAYINYSKLNTEEKEYDRAEFFAENALELLNKSHHIEHRKSVFETLVSIQLGKGNFKKAFEYNEELQGLKDSLNVIKDKKNIAEIETKYQNEKKQQEIELLTSQSQLAAQKANNQRNLLIGGISVLGLAFITVFLLFRNKQKTNFRLRQLEASKSKFFANISHEFRTPLTLISGPVAHQLSKENLTTDDKTDLGLIQRNANRLLKYVDQILDLSKIEAGSRKLRVSKGNMALFLKHLIEPFQYQASQKEITFDDRIDISNEVWFDRDVVEKMVTNLLSNALKYNQNQGKISFKAVQEGQRAIITTLNENHDLTEKELPLLFDRFYQNNTVHEGFGIGLALVQDLASLSYGRARAYKPNPEEIAFEVILPITKGAFSKEDLIMEDEVSEILKHEDEELILDSSLVDEEPEENALPVLLVVDDNAEIRLFIKSLFKKEYQIYEAENGEKGMQIAFKTIPDIVISDVMMPVKDGIDMSNSLKNDERTSHIPIILLTAKSGEENEMAGLKTGADAYMVKPFKEEKLRIVIEKLIATRTAIQEKFNRQSLMRIKGVALTHVDKRLMERIQQILEVDLTNPEFNATTFSEQVGLSRMHLHRKLKALTGLSTSEFIRVQRLKLAAELLKEGHNNISEIGYATGFNQPAYFSTAFRQHFGCSPSEYDEIQRRWVK